jgi:hypothetical protein
MTAKPENPGTDEQQRKQLDRSFERATEQQPQDYRNKASEKKQVEIGADKTADPIKGLDAPETPDGR